MKESPETQGHKYIAYNGLTYAGIENTFIGAQTLESLFDAIDQNPKLFPHNAVIERVSAYRLYSIGVYDLKDKTTSVSYTYKKTKKRNEKILEYGFNEYIKSCDIVLV
jgi:hypothetical protein